MRLEDRANDALNTSEVLKELDPDLSALFAECGNKLIKLIEQLEKKKQTLLVSILSNIGTANQTIEDSLAHALKRSFKTDSIEVSLVKNHLIDYKGKILTFEIHAPMNISHLQMFDIIVETSKQTITIGERVNV
ncbi:hypothetical protein FJY84_03315 [Candidatus Bathyarchaeota archaeon]|nr:hypothetical protein [Candidatus Bathyarchaeota archaeon]